MKSILVPLLAIVAIAGLIQPAVAEDWLLASHTPAYSTSAHTNIEYEPAPAASPAKSRPELGSEYAEGARYYVTVGQDEAAISQVREAAKAKGKGVIVKSASSGWPIGIHEVVVRDRWFTWVQKGMTIRIPPPTANPIQYASHAQPAVYQQPVYQSPVYSSPATFYGSGSACSDGSCGSYSSGFYGGYGSGVSCANGSCGGGFSGGGLFSGFFGGGGGCASCGS